MGMRSSSPLRRTAVWIHQPAPMVVVAVTRLGIRFTGMPCGLRNDKVARPPNDAPNTIAGMKFHSFIAPLTTAGGLPPAWIDVVADFFVKHRLHMRLEGQNGALYKIAPVERAGAGG